MNNPRSILRAGLAAVPLAMVLALTPAGPAAAAVVTVGNTSFTYESTLVEGNRVFMTNWIIDGQTVLNSQGFWLNGFVEQDGDRTPLFIRTTPSPTVDTELDQEVSQIDLVNNATFDTSVAGVLSVTYDLVTGASGDPIVQIVVDYTLQDLGGGQAQITEDFTFINLTDTNDSQNVGGLGDGTVTLDFFVYADPDLGSDTSANTGGFNAARTEYTQTDDNSTGQFQMTASNLLVDDSGAGTSTITQHSEAASAVSPILGSLDNATLTTSLDPLDQTGGAGPPTTIGGDLEVGFQYRIFLANDLSAASFTMVKLASVEQQRPAPEPASIALLGAGGLLMLGAARRARRG